MEGYVGCRAGAAGVRGGEATGRRSERRSGGLVKSPAAGLHLATF